MSQLYGLPDKFPGPVHWACDRLGIPDNVMIVFDREHLSSGYHGEMIDYSLKDKRFQLDIEETLDLRDSLIAIFHELVHVKQIMDGRLKCECGPTIWLGEKYEWGIDPTYGELPWEKEAFFMEEVLYKEYLQVPGNVVKYMLKVEAERKIDA